MILRREYLADQEWCEAKILAEIRSSGAAYPEELLFDVMCRDESAGAHHIDWIRRSRAQRALIAGRAIEALIIKRRIEAVPGATQATGRRFFQEVNPLDAIVGALDASDKDVPSKEAQ